MDDVVVLSDPTARSPSTSIPGARLGGSTRSTRARIPLRGDPLEGFVAAMIWGHGVRGYGSHRVDQLVRYAGSDIRPKLLGMAHAATTDAGAAWDAFTRSHKVRGLGPAFASKYAYFVAFSGGPPHIDLPPLIVDVNTSWAMWDLVQLPRSVERREGYVDYVRTAVAWAGQAQQRPDTIE